MKKNLPVTGVERPFTEGIIVTRTDLKGIITHANDRFVEISGFSREELVGRNHNIVRHPDMPPVLFQDLWDTVRQHRPWRGLVKNRCKNGDHYWVDALIVPVQQHGQTIGFMSVRAPASRKAVAEAERSYPLYMKGQALPRPRRKGVEEKHVRLAWGLASASLFGACALATGPLAGGLAVTGMVLSGGWLWFEHNRAGALQALLKVCDHIAEGRLTAPLEINGRGDCGRLETALATMQVQLKVVIDDLQMTARQVADGSARTRGALEEILRRTEAGNLNVTEMSAAVEELSASIEQVAQNAGDTASLSETSRDTIVSGTRQLDVVRQRTLDAARAVEDAQTRISALSQAISNISRVTQTIHDIADQTNLLALNAAIEAARAGETGRGFAVVADEVRKLAERTSVSTDEINQLVADVQHAASGTIDAMEVVTRETRAGTEVQTRTAAEFESVRSTAVRVHGMMQEIAATNAQQSAAAGTLSSQMVDIASHFDESHRRLGEARGAVETLAEQAEALASRVAHFELEAGRG